MQVARHTAARTPRSVGPTPLLVPTSRPLPGRRRGGTRDRAGRPVGLVNGVGGALEVVLIGVAGLVGLVVGSFLNVVVYRAPLGLSVSTPRSFCPTCDRQLELVGERAPGLVARTPGPLPHVPSADIGPVPAGRGDHGRRLRLGHLGLVTVAAPAAGYCILAAAAIAVALIEYGGQRAPLSVAAVGTAIGQVLDRRRRDLDSTGGASSLVARRRGRRVRRVRRAATRGTRTAGDPRWLRADAPAPGRVLAGRARAA